MSSKQLHSFTEAEDPYFVRGPQEEKKKNGNDNDNDKNDSHSAVVNVDAAAFERGGRPLYRRVWDVVSWEPQVGERLPWYRFYKNRYFRAVVYVLLCAGCTLIYYGWQQFSQMLFRNGAYRELCDPGELLGPDDYCTAQYNRVQSLYTTGLACEFTFGVLAGVLLDHLGPWATGFLGAAMSFTGWMCFMYTSSYFVGMVFFAGAVNLSSFPCFTIGDMFPKYKCFMMSLCIAAQTAGTMVAPILKAIWDANLDWSFKTLIWGYLLTVWVPLVALYLLCLPVKRVQPLEETAVEEPPPDEAAQTETARSETSTVPPEQLLLSYSAEEASFKQQFLSVDYLVFVAYYVLQVMQYAYYPTTVLDQYGANVSDFLGWVLPSQAVTGALFGLVVDRVKTVPISAVLTVSMSLGLLLALIRNTSLQYVTALLYVVSNSYIYTTKYTYVAEIFPTRHFGVLVGSIGAFAGVFTLLNVPIQNANAYTATCLAFIAVGGVCLLCLAVCWVRQKRGLCQYKGTPKPENKPNEF